MQMFIFPYLFKYPVYLHVFVQHLRILLGNKTFLISQWCGQEGFSCTNLEKPFPKYTVLQSSEEDIQGFIIFRICFCKTISPVSRGVPRTEPSFFTSLLIFFTSFALMLLRQQMMTEESSLYTKDAQKECSILLQTLKDLRLKYSLLLYSKPH